MARSSPDQPSRPLATATRPYDPYFGTPLWLATDCRGHVLWAYNTAHLDLLEAYVSAQLRERGSIPGSMSLVERLPAWIKDGRHRSEVLSGIRRLRVIAAWPPARRAAVGPAARPHARGERVQARRRSAPPPC